MYAELTNLLNADEKLALYIYINYKMDSKFIEADLRYNQDEKKDDEDKKMSDSY